MIRNLVFCLTVSTLCLGACDGPTPPGFRLLDLDDRQVDPLADSGDGTRPLATVFLFVRTDCPIANRYAPEIGRIHTEFVPRGVKFFLVYPDPDESAEKIRAHLEEFGHAMGALRDVEHALVKRTDARVYCGRIDDWYVDFGKARAEPVERELRQVLAGLLGGKAVARSSPPAIGCPIAELK